MEVATPSFRFGRAVLVSSNRTAVVGFCGWPQGGILTVGALWLLSAGPVTSYSEKLEGSCREDPMYWRWFLNHSEEAKWQKEPLLTNIHNCCPCTLGRRRLFLSEPDLDLMSLEST